jgi:hypothetical protein
MEKSSLIRRLGVGLFVGWLASCAGCGSGRVTVEGDVTFDGQPVPEGTIVFEPADRLGPTTGARIENGSYRLAGEAAAVPGKKLIRISAVRKTGRQIEAGSPSPPGTMVDEIESYIPAVYNDQSTLECEVTPGGVNRHDFPLKSQ